MMGGMQSELLKYRRTFMGKLIGFIPIFFAVFALVVQATMMNNPLSETSAWAWESLLALVFNWWSFLFLPLGYALFAALVAAQEKKSGNYRALCSHHIPFGTIWFYKVMVMAIYSLLSTVVLIVAVAITGSFSGAGAIPFRQIVTAALVCWLVSLALVPIQLCVATWKGMPLSMGIGFLGMIVGIFAAPEVIWVAVPWSWATRLMCPLIGVHPNGTILETGDPLLDTSVILIGIVVSVVSFLVLTGITAIWFGRREIV